jgi:GH24 family phage-related lysozyme (muramidase)
MIDEDAADQTEDLCEKFEGFRSGPYLCPAGVPSIGFGATFYLDGRPVRLTVAGSDGRERTVTLVLAGRT